jgi:long-chain acyl-CoA synthetase
MLRDAPPKRPLIDPRGLAVLAYTGGTTDDPKGVMLSHRNLMANAIQLRHWLPQARDGRERILAVLPFSHSYGMTACMNLGMALGGTIVLLPRFDVDETLRAIARHQPTMLPGVPSMYNAIKDHPRATRRRLRSIRFCVSGAAPMPVEVQEGFERVTRARLVEGYGLTEAGPVTHANPLAGKRRTGSIGLPLPGTDAKVVDLGTGQPCAPGEVGELLVKGPQVMLGYWRRPKETEEAVGEGWLRTGDLAAMDGEGWFHIVDRKKDIVLTEQGIIYPRDVEEVLYEHAKVFEAAVVGQRVREGVAELKAFVVLKRGEQCTAEEILEFCQRRLQGPLVPRSVEFRGELPKSFVGKVLRRRLAEPGGRR